MECTECHVVKLSSEFPRRRLTKDCKHCPTFCVHCLSRYLARESFCPECNAEVDDALCDQLTEQLRIITQSDSFTQQINSSVPASVSFRGAAIRFTVSLMGGDSHSFEMPSNAPVSQLRNEIQTKFGIADEYQRLLYNGVELKPYSDSIPTTLDGCSIVNGSTMQLMRLMLAIPQDSPYKNINFQLTWTMPYGRRAYLDGACFLYSGRTLQSYVDFKRPYASGIQHSGPAQSRSYHIIQVSLPSVSREITHLFFVLSACREGSLGDFQNPAVVLFDKNRPTQRLSDYPINTRTAYQAAIMCCLVRVGGGWKVYQLGQPSHGNVYNYPPIMSTIRDLFDSHSL